MSVRTAVLLAVVAGLAGCGLKGPLYLPEKSQEVVIRPAPGTAPEAPPGEGAPGPSAEPTAPAGGPPEPPPQATTPTPPAPDASPEPPPGSGRG